MSYSFQVVAATKEEATGKIREQFDAVVVSQPTHAADKETAIVAGQELVRLLAEPGEGEEIVVNMSGYLSWKRDAPDEFVQASMSISTAIRPKVKAA